MRIILLLLCVIPTVSCVTDRGGSSAGGSSSGETAERARFVEESYDVTGSGPRIQVVRDIDTNKCYAWAYYGYASASFGEVACVSK